MKLGLIGILTIIFVVCKLAGVIAWSWWWVFAPVIVGAALSLVFWVGFLLICIIATCVSGGR